MTKYQVILKTGLSSKVVLRTEDKDKAVDKALELAAEPFSHVQVISSLRQTYTYTRNGKQYTGKKLVTDCVYDSNLVLQEV